MENRTILEIYKELIDSYLEIKPVLFDLNKQNNGAYPEAILNEIRALNDHIARCYLPDKKEKDIREELRKADGHLKRLIFDSFKQLNIIFHDNLEAYELKYYGSHWITFDDGIFWKNYIELREKVVKCIEHAKNTESTDSEKAAEFYQQAYILQGEVNALIESNKLTLEGSVLSKGKRMFRSHLTWFISTIILAVVPALIWEAIMNRETLWNYISANFILMLKNTGEWLINIVPK